MRGLIPWRRNREVVWPLAREMEDVMERFFGFTPAEEFPVFREWAPRVDVEETEKEIFVKLDLPGVEAKDVELTVENGNLFVRGERKEEREEHKKNYHRVERTMGKFFRTVPLPAGADLEKVGAASAKGVITVTIPKKAEVLPRKVTVRPEE
jgi:HSP20 family protein